MKNLLDEPIDQDQSMDWTCRDRVVRITWRDGRAGPKNRTGSAKLMFVAVFSFGHGDYSVRDPLPHHKAAQHFALWGRGMKNLPDQRSDHPAGLNHCILGAKRATRPERDRRRNRLRSATLGSMRLRFAGTASIAREFHVPKKKRLANRPSACATEMLCTQPPARYPQPETFVSSSLLGPDARPF
jgi:hypothetical protein